MEQTGIFGVLRLPRDGYTTARRRIGTSAACILRVESSQRRLLGLVVMLHLREIPHPTRVFSSATRQRLLRRALWLQSRLQLSLLHPPAASAADPASSAVESSAQRQVQPRSRHCHVIIFISSCVNGHCYSCAGHSSFSSGRVLYGVGDIGNDHKEAVQEIGGPFKG